VTREYPDWHQEWVDEILRFGFTLTAAKRWVNIVWRCNTNPPEFLWWNDDDLYAITNYGLKSHEITTTLRESTMLMLDRKEVIEHLKMLVENYKLEMERYTGPAKAFYGGKIFAIQEILIWIADDNDLYIRVMPSQTKIFDAIMTAEKSWVEIDRILNQEEGEED